MRDFEFQRLGSRPPEAPGCSCKDWVENLPKLNGPIVLASIRAGRDVYDGKQFLFCPWCGTKIPEAKLTSAVSESEP